MKLFLNDVGLLCAQYANGIQLDILRGDISINFGAVYENFVAQELSAYGFASYYYNNKKPGELDFLIERGGGIVAIEVKSGKDYQRHRALSNLLKNKLYPFEKAIVFTNDNFNQVDELINAPIYMVSFLKESAIIEEAQIYSLDINITGFKND